MWRWLNFLTRVVLRCGKPVGSDQALSGKENSAFSGRVRAERLIHSGYFYDDWLGGDLSDCHNFEGSRNREELIFMILPYGLSETVSRVLSRLV